MSDTAQKIQQQIQSNPCLLYMKGNAIFPQCGFSAQVVGVLDRCQATYATVNVLENPDIRQTLPHVSQWPTFPQLFVNGELIGGCDIVTEMYESGELQDILDAAKVCADEANAVELQD